MQRDKKVAKDTNTASIIKPRKTVSGQVMQEFIPLDAGLALTKEKLVLEHYFGVPDCSANEFIDAGLDSVLSVQLLDEAVNLEQARILVKKYLSNYINWAFYAQMHSVKSQYQENLFRKETKNHKKVFLIIFNLLNCLK